MLEQRIKSGGTHDTSSERLRRGRVMLDRFKSLVTGGLTEKRIDKIMTEKHEREKVMSMMEHGQMEDQREKIMAMMISFSGGGACVPYRISGAGGAVRSYRLQASDQTFSTFVAHTDSTSRSSKSSSADFPIVKGILQLYNCLYAVSMYRQRQGSPHLGMELGEGRHVDLGGGGDLMS